MRRNGPDGSGAGTRSVSANPSKRRSKSPAHFNGGYGYDYGGAPFVDGAPVYYGGYRGWRYFC